MNKVWQDSAPSNIALIKYMGKTDHSKNLPTNVSFSYTVSHLRSFVELEVTNDQDRWEPLKKEGLTVLELSEKGQQRFLNHLERLKKNWNFNGNFIVRSANNFPASCGIASSASSFAALTLCAAQAVSDLKNGDLNKNPIDLCQLSRQGSGSSCRSFFEGWVSWEKDQVETVDLPYKNLIHLVCVTGEHEKEVSTSEAHKIVPSSSLFEGRTQRAEKRYKELIQYLSEKKWQNAYQVCWAEFWDMHSLFETSEPHFGYMNSGSLAAMGEARKMWKKHDDGPLVTMDAGPNVHFFFREEQSELAQSLLKKLSTQFKVLSKDSIQESL